MHNSSLLTVVSLIALTVACGTVSAAPSVPAATTPEQDKAQQDRLDMLATQQAEREANARHDAAEQAKAHKIDQADRDVTTAKQKSEAAQQELDRTTQRVAEQTERDKTARQDAANKAKQDRDDQLQQADLAMKAQADRDAAAAQRKVDAAKLNVEAAKLEVERAEKTKKDIMNEPVQHPQPEQPAQQR